MDMAALVAPTALARHRTLPVAAPLVPLFPTGGLTQGEVVACTGGAGPSLALSLASEASRAGAWLVAIDLPWLGVEAAAELGVALERLVRVDTDRRPATWAKVAGAAADGFELILTPPPRDDRLLRRVQQRVRARGGVLVLVGGPVRSSDVALRATAARWEQAAHGHGHLRARHVQVEATGRRVPLARRATLWLPGPAGPVAAAAEPAPAVRAAELRPVR